jgi:hypothetical protein
MTTRTLSVCIGGMHARLELPDSRLAGELRELLPYKSGSSVVGKTGRARHPDPPKGTGNGASSGRALPNSSPRSGDITLRFTDSGNALKTRQTGWEILIDGYGEYTAVFDMKTRSGLITLAGEPRAEIALNCIRQICARVIIEEGGLVLHAACVVRNASAFVFVGKSGAGKSTVCSLSPHCQIATDDTTVVRRRDGKFVAWGMPACPPSGGAGRPGTGSFKPPADSGPFEITAIFKLVKDKTVRLVPMSGATATAGILALPFFSSEAETVGKMLELVRDLTDCVPCYELHFRKDPSFWKCIEKEMVRKD